VRATRADKQ